MRTLKNTLKHMNKFEIFRILENILCTQQRYAVFGKISAATLPDWPVTIAMAMLFGQSNKLTHLNFPKILHSHAICGLSPCDSRH
jgi:hypothetical protein